MKNQILINDFSSSLSLLNQVVDAEQFILHVIHGYLDGTHDICPITITKEKGISSLQLKDLWNQCLQLVSMVAVKESSIEEVVNILATRGVNEEISYRIGHCMINSHQSLRGKALDNTLSISGSRLVDFDWKTHVVLASDKVGNMMEARTLLSLTCEQLDGGHENTVVELNRKDLQELIKSLDEAAKVVSKLD